VSHCNSVAIADENRSTFGAASPACPPCHHLSNLLHGPQVLCASEGVRACSTLGVHLR
jgi:hypothetical protein